MLIWIIWRTELIKKLVYWYTRWGILKDFIIRLRSATWHHWPRYSCKLALLFLSLFLSFFVRRCWLVRFLDLAQRRTTVGRTSLDEWSARRRDLYLTAHNNRNRHISMPPAGFEPTLWAGERPQTCALDRAATGTGASLCILVHLRAPSFVKSYVEFSDW